jgi:hypothetical protein
MFEEHFFDCPECQAELELARRFRTGMRKGARFATGFAATRWQMAALGAAAAVLVVTAPALIVYHGLQSRVRIGSDALTAERASHQGDLARLSAPPTVIRIVRLDVFRSEASSVTMTAGPGWTVLAIPEPPAPEIISYLAHLETASGESVWQQNDLKPDPSGSLNIAFAPARLTPQNYRLRLESLDRTGRAGPAGQFTLQVVKP